ncbi:MAG: NAD(P)/FAD-dependent oxidoreductase [Muribaculaceae bacterium]|nr:NAD(P)/FAD-dependent oxidoreductase [Muribaculaceae bacterium]MDE6487133.1 NAD(P)/FAD-dependent oxidoreductase [Muribaculaceae bacterium]
MEKKERLVILGAGFGGLTLAKRVDKSKYEVVIVDRRNYHSFPPLFYQVASSGLEPANIAFPLRRELRRSSMRNARFHYGKVQEIDMSSRELVTQYERIPFDRLVIAAGTTNNFFGIEGLDEHVYTMKTVPEAVRARNAVLGRLERASIERDPARRRALLTFVVIGGGPAGVEVAGALGEMKRYIVPREYPGIDRDEVRVILVEGTDKLLGAMSEASGRDAVKALGELMVELRLGRTVKAVADGRVSFADGEVLDADTVVWTAGVTGVPFKITGSDVRAGRGGRFAVDEYNRVEGLEGVYAIGDIAMHADERYPRGCPQVAQPAIQQARTLARNLNAPEFAYPFRYRDKGSMATIGRNRAVVDMGKTHFSGLPAWLLWMGVHLMSLMGMRNRVMVFFNWCLNYFNFGSPLRVLMRPSRLPLPSFRDE